MSDHCDTKIVRVCGAVVMEIHALATIGHQRACRRGQSSYHWPGDNSVSANLTGNSL